MVVSRPKRRPLPKVSRPLSLRPAKTLSVARTRRDGCARPAERSRSAAAEPPIRWIVASSKSSSCIWPESRRFITACSSGVPSALNASPLRRSAAIDPSTPSAAQGAIGSLTAAPTSLPSTSLRSPRPEVLPRRESDSSVALERWQPSCDSPAELVGMCVWRGVASPLGKPSRRGSSTTSAAA